MIFVISSSIAVCAYTPMMGMMSNHLPQMTVEDNHVLHAGSLICATISYFVFLLCFIFSLFSIRAVTLLVPKQEVLFYLRDVYFSWRTILRRYLFSLRSPPCVYLFIY